MNKSRILLVDDDAEDRAIIQDAMELNGAGDILFFAENGEEALHALQQEVDNSITPCLIVLDLNMPKMGGSQTLEHLKKDKRFQHIPVIIYSTSINPLEKQKCMALGAHDYITKPLSFRECMQTAQIFLRYCSSESMAS